LSDDFRLWDLIKEALKTVLPWYLVAIMVVNMVLGLIAEPESLTMFKRIDINILMADLVIIVAIVAVALILHKAHWIFRLSWWRLLASRGSKRWEEGGSIFTIPLKTKFFGLLFVVLVLLYLPRASVGEEELFREGTINWLDGLKRSFLFGMAHLILGIPFSAALAIVGAGMWFTYWYFQGGIELSALYHFHYNLILVGFIFLITLLLQFAPADARQKISD